ncbi:MAG TPA: AarF/UbiB family protein [Stellaceae bacterium]|jgi:ubiquinone biosynthesis protein|nr:AarF/UbiB family protein [Stellaceae bacterium]
MRSLGVLAKLVYLGVAYVWDCGLLGKRGEQGMPRFAGRLRSALLELGGVYVKLGQLLSTRPDLVDPFLSKELEVLLDKCPAEPLNATIETIREELGLTANCRLPFTVLGEVGSASFGCVYRVGLESGDVAAIKILRRGIEVQTVRDLRFLDKLARILDILAVTHRYRVADWVEELRRWTAEELDYQLEARKMTYIAQNVRRVGGIKIPRVIWSLTTRRLLAMEFLEGRWLSNEREAFSDAEHTHAASLLFQAFLYQIFELGFFHADLHKGNLCLLADGRVGVVDFGITGFVSQRMRQRHLGLVAAFQRGALDEAFAALLEISFVSPDANLAGFKRHFEHEYYDWLLRSMQPDFPASKRGAGSLMLAMFRGAYECSIVVDSEVVRYYRAFAIVDAVVTSLDRNFSQHDEIDRYLKSRLRRKVEDLSAVPFDPIGTLAALTTEFAFRASEFRRIVYGYSTSLDSAVTRVLLSVASIKQTLSRLTWAAAIFSLTLNILVRVHLLSRNTIVLQSGLLGRLEVGDLASEVGPMVVVALLLGWFGRLIRARAYSTAKTEASGSGREARGTKK